MNRKTYLKQRAARRGLYVARSWDNPKTWDVIDNCGPCGLQLTYREAVNRADAAARVQHKSRMYGTDAQGKWHRSHCEKVAPKFASHITPCKCHYLVVS